VLEESEKAVIVVFPTFFYVFQVNFYTIGIIVLQTSSNDQMHLFYIVL